MNKENNQTLEQFFAVGNLYQLFQDEVMFIRQDDEGHLWYAIRTQPDKALVDVRIDVDGTTEIYIPS